MGVSKRRLILLVVVVLVVVMIRIPTTDAATPTVENSYTDGGKKIASVTVSNVVVPSSSDRMIIVMVGSVTKTSEDGKFVSGVDFNSGESFSMLGEAQNIQATAAIWYLADPTETTADVVISFDDNNANWEGYAITVEVLSGAASLDTWEAASEGSDTNALHDVTTTSGDLTYGVVAIDGASSLTEQGDGTEIYSYTGSGNHRAAMVSFTADDSAANLDYAIGASEPWVFAGVSVNGAAGGTAYTAYPDGDLTLTGSPSLIADFVKTLVEGFVLTGAPSLVVAFVMTLIEGFTLAGTTSIFVIIQKIIVEGFGLTGGVSLVANFSVVLAVGFTLAGVTSLVANFSVRLIAGFSLSGSVAAAAAYVKTLIEGFSLSGTVTALKVLIVNLQESFLVGVGSTITTIAGVASMIYLLFFSVEMWGYLGPMAIVIGGYFVMTKNKNLGVVWFVVECLIMAQYFALLEATPDYWWHIIILLIGGLSTGLYSLGKR